jgi:hypothetical protein
VQIGFGSEITNQDSKKLKLYTTGLETYYSDSDTIDDKRTLKLLWYNKSEDNKYIGFSDGAYDAGYDEDEYLAAAAVNTRLLAARTELYPDDEVSLSLAADAKDIKIHCQTLYKLIGTDLNHLLTGFEAYLFGIEWSDDNKPFDNLSTTIGNFAKLVNINDSASQTAILLTYYDSVL